MRIDGNGPRRGSRRHLVAAALTVLTAASLRAQADANVGTGTVCDVDGAPLAGARVTFVQEWSQTFGRAMHRVEVATDGDGRFTATLHPGSPYFAWAIGAANAAGERLV